MAHHPVGNHNDADTEHFQDVLARTQQKSLSRRQVIRGGVGLAALSTIPFLPGCGGGGDGGADLDALAKARGSIKKNDALGFDAIDKSVLDEVVLPAGYKFNVVHATGDHLDNKLSYSNTGAELDDWSRRIGDHHDGMEWFGLGADGKRNDNATERGLLAINHEATTDEKLSSFFIHANGGTATLPRRAPRSTRSS